MATKQQPAKDAQKDGIHSLSAINRFGSYKPEEEKQVRTIAPEKSEAMEAILYWWNAIRVGDDGPLLQYYQMISDYYINNKGTRYSANYGKDKAMRYCAEDVEGFSIALIGMPKIRDGFAAKAGVFLSALMNHSKAERFTIHTQGLGSELEYLGFRNRKIIEVDGDIGGHLGCQMKGGKIIVRGDVGGYDMADGMSGGEIRIEGRIINKNNGGIGNHRGGRIFLKGRMVKEPYD